MPLPFARRCRLALPCLLGMVALLGIAHVAFLPPFEGFDESGHYSLIQQIADSGRLPVLGADKLSADVEGYPGPGPEDASRGGGPRSYRGYFAAAPAELPQRVERLYRAGDGDNWESQQPPLYYLSMAPLYRLARAWSWQQNLLLMRLASWAMAFAGFAVGCRASVAALASMGVGGAAILLPGAWPLLFPEFFPEMARLGNDSLCILLLGPAWAGILRLLAVPSRRESLWLGLLLGLGLLTKAIFLPILAGATALLLFAAWRRPRPGRLAAALLPALVAAAIGGGWYVRNLLLSGSLSGVGILVVARQSGGLLGLLAERASLGALWRMLHGLGVLAASFAWAGTWSRAMLPPVLTGPLVLLALLPLVPYLRHLPRGTLEAAAPLFLGLPVLLGLLCQDVLINLLRDLPTGTAGWYLHILAAPLSCALALGWRWPRLFGALALYALAFHALCWATQLSFFSGCAYKPEAHAALRLDPGSCLIRPAHLAALGEPLLGTAALAAAALLGIAALAAMRGAHAARGAAA